MNETICTIMKRGSLRRYKEENIWNGIKRNKEKILIP